MRRAAKKITAMPAPDTEYTACSFSELADRFIIVAFRERQSDGTDGWRYTFDTADMPIWHSARAAGIVVAATQRRPAGLVLLGKLA